MRDDLRQLLHATGAALLAVALAGCPPVYGPGGPTPASQPAPASPVTGAADAEEDVPPRLAQPADHSPTPTEMASGAQEMTSRMGRMLARVERRDAAARAANDAVRRDCVAERLLQVRGLVAATDAARARLERAVGQSHLAAAQQEYSSIGVAFLKSRLLAAESRQCMIDPPRIGRTETTVTVEPLKRGDRATAPGPPPEAPR